MCIHTHMYMYIHTYVCMHTHVYMYMHITYFVWMSGAATIVPQPCTYVHVHVHVHVHTYMCMCIRTCTCTYIRTLFGCQVLQQLLRSHVHALLLCLQTLRQPISCHEKRHVHSYVHITAAAMITLQYNKYALIKPIHLNNEMYLLITAAAMITLQYNKYALIKQIHLNNVITKLHSEMK